MFTLEQAREYFKDDRYAMETGAVIDEVGDGYAKVHCTVTEMHLNARGVVNENAAAFFGITLHADKEILMMVVERDLRDQVLNAIYKEMGMAKKAKGIAFSLPVSDVAGLAPKMVAEPEAE